MKKPTLFSSRFNYFSIGLAVESSGLMTGKAIIEKDKTIRQNIETGVVEALYPQIVGGRKPKEVFVWKPLTRESAMQCIIQVRHLNDRRNTGLASVEKIIRLKKEDFVAA